MAFDHPQFDDHERVCHVRDARSGLSAIVAIHRTVEGRATGGVRFRPYADASQALTDVLRLSKAMTYKNVLAGLPTGGGKSVILGDPSRDKSPALLRAFGRAVEGFGGAYLCGPDVGTSSDDMDVIAEETRYVGATNRQMGSSGPPTALGVFRAVSALAEYLNGTAELTGVRVAIQGVGAVGSGLAVHLVEAGARVTVADVDAAAVRALEARAGVRIVGPDEILSTEADILSPCALGSVLSADTIPRLRVRGVCGGANNQLATDDDGARLADRGIAFVPDFVASAGGVIAGTAAAGLYPASEMQGKLDGIRARTLEILERAARDGERPEAVAERIARELLAKAGV